MRGAGSCGAWGRRGAGGADGRDSVRLEPDGDGAGAVPDGRKWRTDSWKDRCLAKQAEIAANESRVFDVVFFGDSITHNWERDDAWGVYAQYGGFGKEVWTNVFANLRVLNIGIGGDRTQDLLWRGMNGDLDNYAAKMFVVMIGTNNVRANSPEEIAAGVKAVVELVKAKHPESKILLYAIFPRGEKADDRLRAKHPEAKVMIVRAKPDGTDPEDEMWKRVVRFNFWAKGLCDSKTVFFCDYDKGDDVKARMQAILDGGRGMERKLAFPEYPETSLTLMTYNIHSGWGMYGQGWNLNDPIEVIRKVRPDVCTLNEVSWGGAAKGFQVDEPTIMGHVLNPMWRTMGS